MITKQIWERANEHWELIRTLYRAICEGKDIDAMMSQLKQHIPCLFGVDFDQRTLVFKSAFDCERRGRHAGAGFGDSYPARLSIGKV